MRVVKIIERIPIINADGKWQLFCQVMIGNSYVYGAIICDTREEASSIKEGQILDIEKVVFSRRINIQ
jgi:hypothetical protein